MNGAVRIFEAVSGEGESDRSWFSEVALRGQFDDACEAGSRGWFAEDAFYLAKHFVGSDDLLIGH